MNDAQKLRLWTAAVEAAPVNTPISQAVWILCSNMTPRDWEVEGIREVDAKVWADELRASGL
jgi:hypothetical protein